MTRTLFFTLILLCGSAWIAAQDTSSSSGTQTDKEKLSHQMHTSETTIRGCLSGSADNYTLTDSTGTKYQLQGKTSSLSSNLNNEVELRGTPSGTPGTGTQGTGTATTQGAVQTFSVMKVKKIANTCSSK
jgi:hypothetical protein